MKEKYRTGIPGHSDLGKVVNESAWGEQTATQRYGGGTRHPDMSGGAFEDNKPQKLGDANNLQDKKYDNDARGWVRAEGETAESRAEGFTPGYRAPRGEPGERGAPPLRSTDKFGPHR